MKAWARVMVAVFTIGSITRKGDCMEARTVCADAAEVKNVAPKARTSALDNTVAFEAANDRNFMGAPE